MKIQILDEAIKDIENGIYFYESQKEGLGSYFLDSVISDIESLHVFVGIHFQVKDYFRLLCKRFPFAIYYKFDTEFIFIYAVLDCRRNPTWNQRRLHKGM